MLTATATFDLSNFQRIKKIVPGVSLVIKDALDEYAEKVLAESQTLVPVETGNLRDSGEIDYIDVGGGNFPQVAITYTADYALYIHEDLQLNHPNGGQAKYLEQPMNEDAPELIKNIQTRITNLIMGE